MLPLLMLMGRERVMGVTNSEVLLSIDLPASSTAQYATEPYTSCMSVFLSGTVNLSSKKKHGHPPFILLFYHFLRESSYDGML